MNNGQINKAFLDKVSNTVSNKIKKDIANHYGTDVATIEVELFDDEAEHLLEYVTVDRPVVHLYMNRVGLDKPAQ